VPGGLFGEVEGFGLSHDFDDTASRAAAVADLSNRLLALPVKICCMKITAALMPEAIETCLPFWVDRMGFAKTVEVPEGDRLGFVILERDGAELMLQTAESVRKDEPAFAPDGPPRGTGLFIEVKDFADTLRRLSGYPIALPERTTFYGMREIGVFTPGGHVVVFAAPIGATPAEKVDPAAAQKQAAAERAAALVENGMVVGLGSGSTAALAVRVLGRRVAEGLKIVGVPTSESTAALARSLGIPLSDLAAHERLDLTIDGADEVEVGTLHLVKGLGGALLREKIVASATARLVIVADPSKVVERLRIHQGPIPIEVAPFGWESTARRLRAMGGEFKMRLGADGKPFVSDGGHYILDAGFSGFDSAEELALALDRTVGVMEHGMFLGMAEQAIIGGATDVQVLNRRA
jgi:ribose 5-phosphate isomerase A